MVGQFQDVILVPIRGGELSWEDQDGALEKAPTPTGSFPASPLPPLLSFEKAKLSAQVLKVLHPLHIPFKYFLLLLFFDLPMSPRVTLNFSPTTPGLGAEHGPRGFTKLGERSP